MAGVRFFRSTSAAQVVCRRPRRRFTTRNYHFLEDISMLRSARTFTPVRALVAASLLAAAASLAACADGTTAPKTQTLAPTTESQQSVSLNLGAYIKLHIADTTGATLKETAWVTFYSGNDTLDVRDNAAGDLDPAVGYMKVMMSKTNNYKVRVGRSAHYMPDLDGSVNWRYIGTSTSAAMTVDMGDFFLQRSPMFNFVAWDEFGALAPGATYKLTTDVNWSILLQDGDYRYDESTKNGLLIYTLNFPFKVTICEVKPPSHMVLTSQQCFSFPAKWGQTYTMTFNHEHVAF
jgi:hypothetical protein